MAVSAPERERGSRDEDRDYRRLTTALKRQSGGLTVADAVARSALPLETVRELLPRAADEYSGRLQVTESGEILYSFPQGFTSRYRGFRARLGRFFRELGRGARIVASFLFKAWIMLMLVGYFALFMLLALAALLLSVAASGSSSGRDRRRGDGGMFLVSGIFNTIIRIWFYSELLKPADRRYREEKPRGRPLHKAIFSFVFGDGDPNALWEEQERKAVIAYVQAHGGILSTPELAALTGLSLQEADRRITGYCAEFNGSPEATEAGTVIYRFEELLRRADTRNRSFPGLSGPFKGLRVFSSNKKKMNLWFSVINAVNLLFGGYFFFSALNTGHILSNTVITNFNYFYALVYTILSRFLRDPLGAISLGLGLVPLAFSALFWLVPALRFFRLRKENEGIKLENFRKENYSRIWQNPLEVKAGDLGGSVPESRPRDLEGARDRVIKEAGAYAQPEVSLDDAGNTVYAFTGLEREREALEQSRAGVDRGASELGKTIFDSGA
ncbi:MAG: hypothetical protein LBQ35_04220 [Spirochaetaceae bacterium]|jgi:hypothetical protein|nr:hypothetical protein [Spirochaetaceae bacterium]